MTKKQAFKLANKLISLSYSNIDVELIWGIDGLPDEHKDANAAWYFYEEIPDGDLHLNPEYFKNHTYYECKETLVHEMIHLNMRDSQFVLSVDHMGMLEKDTERMARFIMKLLEAEKHEE